jgi:hypothetical protein
VGSGEKGSGVMTSGAAGVLLAVFGVLGLLAVWVGTVVMGLAGSALAKRLPPLGAGAVVFVACSMGAPAFLLFALVGRSLEPH